MKTLSIITVTWNNSSELHKTIFNVSNIINEECEHIIIDGASTDDTLKILNSKWPHILRYYSEPDKGIYDAMNKGIALSNAKWILFLNAGDYLFDTDFLKIIDLLNSSESDYIFFKQFNNNLYTKFVNRRFSMPTSHQAQVYRKSTLVNNNFDLTYRVGADFDLYKRLVNDSNILKTYSEFAISRVSPPGYSKYNEDILIKDYSQIINEHEGKFYYYLYRYLIGDLIANHIKNIFPRSIRSFFRNILKL